MAFGNYSKQAPQAGKTVPYVLRGLRNPDGTSPVLHVEHIGEANRAFWLEALAKMSARDRKGTQPGSTPAEIDRANREDREESRGTVASHSARRIENAFHDDGAPATVADIPAIVAALPDADFDRLWMFVQNHNNFRDYAIVEEPGKLAEK
jgi:hypothetical protein